MKKARTQYPNNLYLSPVFSMNRLKGLIEKYGENIALTNTKYKAERELWIAGIFLLGISSKNSRKYWLKPNSEDTSPDIISISPKKTEIGAVGELQNIEVFEYETHNKKTLAKALIAKIKKHYPDDFLLICYVHGHEGEIFNHKEIVDEVRLINPNIRELWVISSIQDARGDHAISKIHPNADVIFFKLNKLISLNGQTDMIEVSKGMEKEIKFTPKGPKILRLP